MSDSTKTNEIAEDLELTEEETEDVKGGRGHRLSHEEMILKHRRHKS